MSNWLLSSLWYLGGLMFVLGVICLVRPFAWLRIPTRRRAATVAVLGAMLAIGTLFAGTAVQRVASPASLIDEVLPAFQLSETHQIEIEAPPPAVYRAVREVTADEIALYRTLTWIRCLGSCPGDNILNPAKGTPILETAMRSGFKLIAETPDVELVLVTFVAAPPGARSRQWTREAFVSLEDPGFAKAAMNFRVEANGPGRAIVHTDTRVFATDPHTLRAFTIYWRTIAPGSDLIRRGWLRAIKRRAEFTRGLSGDLADPVRAKSSSRRGEPAIGGPERHPVDERAGQEVRGSFLFLHRRDRVQVVREIEYEHDLVLRDRGSVDSG